MSRNSVSPFFSHKFQPIFSPTSPSHSTHSVPAVAHGDVNRSQDTAGVSSHFHENNSPVHVSQSNSVNELHSASAPQLHVHTKGSEQQTSSPRHRPVQHSNSVDSVQQASSASTYSQSHLPLTATKSSPDSRALHRLPLTVIDEDSYEEKSDNIPRQAKLEQKESDGGESSTKRTSKLQQQRRLLAKDLDSMYPWRQKMPTSTGMSFIQHADFNVDATLLNEDQVPVGSGWDDPSPSSETSSQQQFVHHHSPTSPQTSPQRSIGNPSSETSSQQQFGHHHSPTSPQRSSQQQFVHHHSPSSPQTSPQRSIGIRDLEYSMEPRNFSRGPSKLLFGTAPVVAGAPRDVAKTVDVPVDADHSTQILSAHVSALPTIAACSAILAKEETKAETFYDALLPLSEKFNEQRSAGRQPPSSVSKENDFIYDQLAPLPKKDQVLAGSRLNDPSPSGAASSDYDLLLPLAPKYQPSSAASPLSPPSGGMVMRGGHGAAIAPLTPPLPPKATASSTSTRPYTTYGHPHRPMPGPHTNPNAGERINPAGAMGGQRAVERHSLATAPSDAEFDKDIAALTPPLPPRKATAGSTSTRPYTTYGHPQQPMPVPHTNPNAGERSNPAGPLGGQRAVKRHSLASAPSDGEFDKDIAALTPPLPPKKATASSTSTRPYTTYGHPQQPMPVPHTNPNAGERSNPAGPLGGQRAVKRHSLATAPSDAEFVKNIAPLTPPLPPRATASSNSTRPYSTYGHPNRPKPIPRTNPNAGERSNRSPLAATHSDAEFGKEKREIPPVRRASNLSKPRFGLASRPFSIAGTEESLGWNFVAGGTPDVPNVHQADQKLHVDRNRWTRRWFGGGEKVVHDLFNPRKAYKVKKYLQEPGSDVNAANVAGDAPLHCYVKSDRADKLELIYTLLVHCNYKVLQIDKPNSEGKPPLHVAIEMNDLWAAKMIIAFGADLNCQNRFGDTPLDLVSDALNQGEYHEIHEMLTVLHAAPGGSTSPTSPYSLQPLNESINSITNESYDIEESQQLGTYLDEKRHTAFVFKLEELLSKQNLEFSVNTNVSLPPGMMDNLGTHTFFDAMIARQNQLLRINEWKSTVEFKKGSGSRMLYLDGGGIRGLIEIDVLERIEALTGRRITELFDWIIGTSTGGILALCLVYLGMTLGELRQLYFRMREEVFVGGMFSVSKKTDALEALLQQQFGDKCMNDVEFPKVLISAVSTKTSPPKLNFFNNCFDDEYSKQLVWKVARYTSAAPMYFTECDNYMDGGVLANNPSLLAWTLIQTYHDNYHLPKPKVAMAVSLGTGRYPSQKLGETDILGKGLLNLKGTMKRAQRFIKMISTALVESESVASTFHATCKALDIKFFRFSPSLPSVIPPDETDIKVLVDMLIQTKQYLNLQDSKRNLDEMVRLFQHISEVSRGLNLEKT